MISYPFLALIVHDYFFTFWSVSDPTRPDRPEIDPEKTSILDCVKPKKKRLTKKMWKKLADSCRGKPERTVNFYATSSSPSIHFVTPDCTFQSFFPSGVRGREILCVVGHAKSLNAHHIFPENRRMGLGV